MKTIAKLAFVTAILAAPFSLYAGSHSAAPASASSSANEKTEGEVRKVDKDAKKITIKHAELKHLEMPAMTMVFQVKNPAMLDKVKQGDKVIFVAEKVGGQFTVTQIEAKQ
ncbi:copper-binding protein [Noviherbaspirillum saxi]|uniref:Copper-binding protein n=1 Tax=Noviherbaspirillum saxi TaxID=2320863 RepID=A0A3A3FUF3_9BURK|nr:copper-binding protein [Noviherbaspirillum saxi]RJF98168.1 copper-binding protein [Noviherbaspirillum saxi]